MISISIFLGKNIPYMERNTDRKPDSLYLDIFTEILKRMTWSIIKITNAGYSSYGGVVAVKRLFGEITEKNRGREM